MNWNGKKDPQNKGNKSWYSGWQDVPKAWKAYIKLSMRYAAQVTRLPLSLLSGKGPHLEGNDHR